MIDIKLKSFFFEWDWKLCIFHYEIIKYCDKIVKYCY